MSAHATSRSGLRLAAETKSPGFVWRAEVQALSTELARFEFLREWPGMILSHDVRPSELEVEEVRHG